MTKDFLKFFGKAVSALGDGAIFANSDTKENIMEERGRRAQNANLQGNMADAGVEDFSKTLKQKTYARGFLSNLRKGGKKVAAALICDLSQNPAVRNRAGRIMPTITKGCELVLLARDQASDSDSYHFFTPREIAFAQGWPSLPNISDEYAHCAGFDLHSLSVPTQKSLQGNSMHLLCVAAWHLYVWSHVVRRDLLCKIAPSVPFVVPVADFQDKRRRTSNEAKASGHQPPKRGVYYNVVAAIV